MTPKFLLHRESGDILQVDNEIHFWHHLESDGSYSLGCIFENYIYFGTPYTELVDTLKDYDEIERN